MVLIEAGPVTAIGRNRRHRSVTKTHRCYYLRVTSGLLLSSIQSKYVSRTRTIVVGMMVESSDPNSEMATRSSRSGECVSWCLPDDTQ